MAGEGSTGPHGIDVTGAPPGVKTPGYTKEARLRGLASGSLFASKEPNRLAGLLALCCFAAHAAYHISRHEAHDLLWTCNFACLVVALSCLANYRDGVAVGVSWLSVGIPLWILDLSTGGEFVPTSALTHLGGYAAGIFAIRKLRWPPGIWWKATAAQLTLILVTRLVTPPKANVNLAFSVWGGWEKYFPTFGAYFFLLFAGSLVVYLAVDRAGRRLLLQ